MRAILLTMFLCAAVTVTSAQDRFKVLAVRGKVTCNAGSVRLGMKLGLKERVTVAKGGYVSLAHNNGRTLELNKEGAYKIADLDKAATKKSSSVSGKFAAYVYNELTEVDEPIAFKDDHKGRMKTVGAVERADGDDVSVVDSIDAAVGGMGEARQLAVVAYNGMAKGKELVAIMPRHTRLIGDSVTFVWHRLPNTSKYKVVVLDRENREIFGREVSDTSSMVTMAQLPMTPGQVYFWHVEGGGDVRSDEYALYRLTPAERAEAEAVVRGAKDDMDDDQSAIARLILAVAYEDQGLMYDAHRAYIDAVNIAPGIQNYKRLHAEFLRRQGLNYDAYQAYR